MIENSISIVFKKRDSHVWIYQTHIYEGPKKN